MSSARQRAGSATRIGVAAMIVISLVLASLLLPKIQDAREAGRRNSCGCHSRNLGLSLVTYAEGKKHFPGYVNKVGGKTASWLVPMLPYLDRNDLYSKWNDPTVPIEAAPVPSYSLPICPSDPLASSAPPGALSYIVNAGEATIESPANGVLLDLRDETSQSKWVSLNYVVEHDGAQNTLVLTESTLAGPWNIANAKTAKLQCAFVWHKTPNPTDAMTPAGSRDGLSRPNTDLIYARPPSAHPNTFNATFADAHMKAISNDIDYIVYRQLMTPNNAESDNPSDYLLSEKDF